MPGVVQVEEGRRGADARMRMLLTLAENTYYDSLHVAFVVLCVQESVWVFVPTCYTLNLVAHSSVLSLSASVHCLTIVLSVYFSLIGVALVVTLVLAQKFGLQRHQPVFLWPYVIVKAIRVAITTIGALLLALMTGGQQLHLLAYCCIEIVVGVLAIDVAWRTMAFLRKIQRRRERIIVGSELSKIYSRKGARY